MKIKLYYGWKESCGEQELTVWNTDYVAERNGYAGCGSFEIEADIQAPSHEETINAKVSELRKEQAEFVMKANLIEQQIQELLCIEYKPEEEHD